MSIWQTKSWQEMLVKSHQTERYFEIDRVFVEKRKVAFWEYGLFALWVDFEKVNFGELIELCKKEKCLFIQVENIDYKCNSRDVSAIHLYKKNFYKKFITPYTAVIDLTKNENEILAWMKQKWRYNIRLAEKKWIEVKEVAKTKENVKIFHDLMLETTKRDNFFGNNLEYYFDLLNWINSSKLLFANYEWKTISAWIFVYEDDVAIYYYWASTSDEKFRNLMSPYLLQWQAILTWKKLNCKIYDFLGVATPWDKHSHLIWVSDFKAKFTQDIRKVSESYIWINKKWKFLLISIFRRLKKSV